MPLRLDNEIQRVITSQENSLTEDYVKNLKEIPKKVYEAA